MGRLLAWRRMASRLRRGRDSRVDVDGGNRYGARRAQLAVVKLRLPQGTRWPLNVRQMSNFFASRPFANMITRRLTFGLQPLARHGVALCFDRLIQGRPILPLKSLKYPDSRMTRVVLQPSFQRNTFNIVRSIYIVANMYGTPYSYIQPTRYGESIGSL